MRSGTLRWLLATGLVLSGLITYAYLKGHANDFRRKVYRMGWQSDPPFQEPASDGSPSGLAIEMVRDAARIRGIQLQWVLYPAGAEAALRSHAVDLWPLLTITPERRGVFHISNPYLQHDSVLLVRAASPYFRLQDLASAPIAYYELPINERLLRQVLPHAGLTSTPSQKDSVERLCTLRSDAAFMDEFTANSALLSGLGCPSQALRIIPLPKLRTSLGIGATLENAGVADEIRRGLDAVVAGGDLTAILSHWGQLSSRNFAYFTELVSAGRRQRWLLAALWIITCLLALSIAAVYRIRIQKDRIAIAEGALRSTEHKLRLLANSLNEVVLGFDMQRSLVYSNPALQRLTGYTAEDVQENKGLCWVHPDDQSRVAEKWNTLFEGCSYRDLEYRIVTKDGQLKWATGTWGPMLGDDGRQIGIYGCDREITKRKLALQALHESERQFRELLEGVQLLALIIDLTGTIRFCNDYTLTLTSWKSDQVTGQAAADLLDAPFLSRLLQEADTVEPLPLIEGTILTRGGDCRRIQWSSARLRDSNGRPAGVACLGADVTELEALRAEAAKRESDERFRTIADNAPLVIWVTGPDKGCTFVNRGWLSFTGRTLEEELGTGWIANIHPGDVESCLSNYEEAFASRSSFHVQYRKRRWDGEYRWVLGSGLPRYGPAGEFDGYIGTCVDITDLRREQTESIARQKLETVTALASGIAHDFNNLLAAVVAQADLATANLAQGDSPEDQLQTIRTVALRGAGIVRQLLIYAGQEKAVLEAIDLSNIVEESLELLKVVISKHAMLKTDLARNLPATEANPAQIRQVLLNLVINASEAIGERDGVIAIRTACVAESADSSARPAGEYLVLEVSDTGGGIAVEHQARLFEPFFTTKSPGHGLGLAVVQGIVRGLGGFIGIESEPGSGTTVRLSFVSTGRPPNRELPVVPAAPPPPAPRQELVLVVEDESTLRLASATILRRRGYSVLEAADGNTAIRLIREHKSAIAVLLLDITLPGAPSREVYMEARLARPDMKVVVTSAYGQNAVDTSFPELPIDAFLRKPYQLAHLIDLIRDLTSRCSQTANP